MTLIAATAVGLALVGLGYVARMLEERFEFHRDRERLAELGVLDDIEQAVVVAARKARRRQVAEG